MDVKLELSEACKLALAHLRWMEAIGYTVPPLPGGRSLPDVLTATMSNAARKGYVRKPKTEQIRLDDLREAPAAAGD